MNETTAATTTATRKTAKGEKVYIHTGCTCAKVNGKVVREAGTVALAKAYAAERGLEWTLCKTSVIEEAVEALVDDAAELDQDEEEGFEGGGSPEFIVVVDNTDQFGKQRRDAIAAMVDALGAEMTFKGIKNKHRTGNDAFQVEVSQAPAHLQPLVEGFLAELDEEVPEVVEEAKGEGIAEGWDANTRQKHYKNSARAYIVRKGAQVAARLA